MAEASGLMETVDLLYQAAVEPELWPQALHRFALDCGGFGTAMIPITPGDTTGLVLSPQLLESRPEYDREWYRHDTRVLRIFRRGLSKGVCCEAELFTEEEIARDPMRQEFCRKYGMGSFAAQLVPTMPNFVVAFSVMRALPRGEFEKRELNTLGLLGKHAARALLISASLTGDRGLARSLAGLMERLACAVFAVDRQMRVVFANPAAEQVLGEGLCVTNGELRPQSRAHRESLVRLVKSVLEPSADVRGLETVALPRPGARLPLLVQAVPVTLQARDWTVPHGAAALVIAVDPEADRRVTSAEALRRLGLTPAEGRLAALIGAGCSRAEAAGRLGISAATASDTLKQVYSKLGIARQSELVRLVERLATLSA